MPLQQHRTIVLPLYLLELAETACDPRTLEDSGVTSPTDADRALHAALVAAKDPDHARAWWAQIGDDLDLPNDRPTLDALGLEVGRVTRRNQELEDQHKLDQGAWEALANLTDRLQAALDLGPGTSPAECVDAVERARADYMRRDFEQAKQICETVGEKIVEAEKRLYDEDDPHHPADALAACFTHRVVDEIERLRGMRGASQAEVEAAARVLRGALDMDSPEWAAMNTLLDAASRDVPELTVEDVNAEAAAFVSSLETAHPDGEVTITSAAEGKDGNVTYTSGPAVEVAPTGVIRFTPSPVTDALRELMLEAIGDAEWTKPAGREPFLIDLVAGMREIMERRREPSPYPDESTPGFPRSELLAAVDDHMRGNCYRLQDGISSASVVRGLSSDNKRLRKSLVAFMNADCDAPIESLELAAARYRLWSRVTEGIKAAIADAGYGQCWGADATIVDLNKRLREATARLSGAHPAVFSARKAIKRAGLDESLSSAEAIDSLASELRTERTVLSREARTKASEARAQASKTDVFTFATSARIESRRIPTDVNADGVGQLFVLTWTAACADWEPCRGETVFAGGKPYTVEGAGVATRVELVRELPF